jgi:hypothetical protein
MREELTLRPNGLRQPPPASSGARERECTAQCTTLQNRPDRAVGCTHLLGALCVAQAAAAAAI